MSAPAHIYHRGVLKVAGAVHVGPHHLQVRHYLYDAGSYARRALSLPEYYAQQARRDIEETDECHRRALVCAAVAMLTWGLS